MNIISKLKAHVTKLIKQVFAITDAQLTGIELKLNVDKGTAFGDLSCNAAMVLAKVVGKNPRELALILKETLKDPLIQSVEIAGPGFINITLTDQAWQQVALDLFLKKDGNFKINEKDKLLRYQIEFVSANPTGPLHFGHGRGGIIGDTLAHVLTFLGHSVTKEFYINDAGNQIKLLGQSFKIRCMQVMGHEQEIPEGGYAGEYLLDLARACFQEYGQELATKDDLFFITYAKEHMLKLAKETLQSYGVVFDQWFSEKILHDNGSVEEGLALLQKAGLAYEQDGALWFKSTEFGDDKDRVIKKSTGELTYIAGDIAYHKNKFDRGYDKMIDILGCDHHGYVKRLKATMQALGYDASKLDVILYQLVSLKENDELVRMSKRAGKFTKLSDVIEAVGPDVTRFFFLNRKADAHLEFDLAVALKKTDENPVYYIQYAFVRTKSLLAKAHEQKIASLQPSHEMLVLIGEAERTLLRKIISLTEVLTNISQTYQTHILAYYTWELARDFHTFYASNRIVDTTNMPVTQMRLFMVNLVSQTLETCLDLLGLSKPERM